MIEPLLLTSARVSTFDIDRPLTSASGFFFERDDALFFVTSRHVVFDEPSGHHPSRIDIEVHVDATNLARAETLSLPLYAQGRSLWRDGRDRGGDIDVAVLRIDRAMLPKSALLRPFKPQHLLSSLTDAEAGTSLLVVGFPLGFHDALHHLPVVRHAVIASSFGLRFQDQGYFLTDARTHRGSSGAAVVMRDEGGDGDLPWRLLGVHSSSMDMGDRDLRLDDALGLNCAWYADVLMTLTEPTRPAH